MNKKNVRDKIIILGANGHGRVVADIVMKMNRWNQIKFLDDDETIKSSMGIEVVGKVYDMYKFINDYDLFVAIGNNRIREKIQSQLEAAGASIPVLIHPSAIIGEQVKFGIGTVVMAGVMINTCTTIGKGCIINTGAIIDHDSIIQDFVHISPGVCIAGTVEVGRGTWIGIGSTVINNITITSDCIVGAGAVVVKDIVEKGTYVGVPAIKLEKGEIE